GGEDTASAKHHAPPAPSPALPGTLSRKREREKPHTLRIASKGHTLRPSPASEGGHALLPSPACGRGAGGEGTASAKRRAPPVLSPALPGTLSRKRERGKPQTLRVASTGGTCEARRAGAQV